MAKNKENIVTTDVPRMVSSHNVHLDEDYAVWMADLKTRYRKAQVRAAIKVNAEQLLFNWQLGRDLVQKKAEERWGAGVVEQVSMDLKAEFPPATGFSARNLWDMKMWYLFYANKIQSTKLRQAVAEMHPADNVRARDLRQIAGELTDEQKLQQVVAEFPEVFSYVPWGHHIMIARKSASLEEALFYIRQTIERGYSRDALARAIEADTFHTQGAALSNYTSTLPSVQGAMMQEMVRSNYDFSFATVKHATYDETELEDALYANITEMLLELGNGFAFIGRQKEILAVGKDRKVDLLFYHIRQRCYVVVELKARAFEPEFASKLNFYVNACNDLLKQPEDNPTCGLLICTDYDETEVRWAFEGIQTPLGIAKYDNLRIQELLPTKEQIKERIKRLKAELREAKRIEKTN